MLEKKGNLLSHQIEPLKGRRDWGKVAEVVQHLQIVSCTQEYR
jgi:hypothetical protein